MNGRLYDPRQARFISADPFVQDPFFTQDFNRYAFARNSPLDYRDPTGFDGEPVPQAVDPENPAPVEASPTNTVSGTVTAIGAGGDWASFSFSSDSAVIEPVAWGGPTVTSGHADDNGTVGTLVGSGTDDIGAGYPSMGSPARANQSVPGGNGPFPGNASNTFAVVAGTGVGAGYRGRPPSVPKYLPEPGLRHPFVDPSDIAMAVATAGMSLGEVALKEAAESGSTTLFRAVTAAELGSITKAGGFRLLPGQIGKYFTLSLEEASLYASMASRAAGMAGTDFFIAQTTLRSSLLEGLGEQGIEGGIRSVFVPAHLIPQLRPPTVLNFAASGR